MERDDKRLIRVLAGPLAGAVFEVGDGLTFGRADTSEVRLAISDVSRQHARLVPLHDGGLALSDLGSANGTFVDEQRIEWVRLEVGAEFSIAGSRFVVESGAAVPSALPEVSSGAYSVVRTAAPGDDSAAPTGCRDATATYCGDVLDDIIQFRRLRASLTRDGAGSRQHRERLEALEISLGVMASGGTDFAYDGPASVRTAEGGDHGVEVQSIGVQGACILTHGVVLAPGQWVWLAAPLVTPRLSRTAVFAAVVMTVRGGVARVEFSGTAAWAAASDVRSRAPTAMSPDPEPSPAAVGPRMRTEARSV